MKVRLSVLVALVLPLSACKADGDATGSQWEGQVDSLPNGRVSVQNLGRGVWPSSGGWRLNLELRIGAVDSEGPNNFGRIVSMAIDHEGRFWVLDGHANELRVFAPTGEHVRTVGRAGSGPGEFQQPVRVDVGPDGNIWVMDPQNTRLSVFDSAGSYVQGMRVPGGFIIMPWQGGFDEGGYYYAPVVSYEPEFRVALGRFDRTYTLLQTIPLPTDPVERSGFRIVSDGVARVTAGVPFQGRVVWRLSKAGTVWALITDQYRLFELTDGGDTLRSITKTDSPIPVTAAEMQEALDDLRWFTDQGGKVKASRIPVHKPAVNWFFLDDANHLWVARATAPGDEVQPFDVFNPAGQYLGTVTAPFRLEGAPLPIVRAGMLYGVIRDQLDVPYVVRAKIEKP